MRCDTGQQSFCQATVFPAMVMVVGCEENLTEARMSSHASALLNTRGCSHSSEWKKLRGRVMYPFSIFADYRHFADSERKNREKGREMPWHFRIDVRVKYGVRFAQKSHKSFQIKQISSAQRAEAIITVRQVKQIKKDKKI